MEEALDSFDESPEIKQEAVNFLVGDALIEIKEPGDDYQDDKTQKTVSFTSNAAKVGYELVDIQKRTARPALLKINSSQSDEEEDTTSMIRSPSVIAISHSHSKPDVDVTIVVEDEC